MPLMTYDQFCKSIFQLVDIWTESCEAKEYIDMLERILRWAGDHIATHHPPFHQALSRSPHA